MTTSECGHRKHSLHGPPSKSDITAAHWVGCDCELKCQKTTGCHAWTHCGTMRECVPGSGIGHVGLCCLHTHCSPSSGKCGLADTDEIALPGTLRLHPDGVNLIGLPGVSASFLGLYIIFFFLNINYYLLEKEKSLFGLTWPFLGSTTLPYAVLR